MDPASPKRTAVVILNWNGKKFLEQFLGSVVSNSGPAARIIVADNASTDGSLDLLEREFPFVERIVMKENTGFTGGYNRALKQVDAEYYVLLNSDIEVTPGWLDPIIQFMDAHPKVAACQPKILDYYRRELFEYAGAAGGYLDRLGFPYCRGRIFGTLEKDNHQYDDVRPVFWATGACMIVRAATYHAVGGLDERFFAHMEEIDLCWKLHRAGFEVYSFPASVIYHVGGGTLSRKNPRKTYLNFRNNLLMLENNLVRKEFSKIYRRRVVLDCIAAAKFFLSGGRKDASAVLRAHLDFRRIRNSSSDFSTKHPKSTSIKSFEGGAFSILFQYYLYGRKRFSSLKSVS